jgi:2-methylcitrate dehydratase PrpD
LPEKSEPAALALAKWAIAFEADARDLHLARVALLDTVSVSIAAMDDPELGPIAAELSKPALLGTLAHLLDYDDLHVPSTTHISAVCVPATLATGGDARAYLAGAGVMARLGTAMGWEHYTSGWHATCTAGAIGAAVCAAIAFGLDEEQTAHAIVLAIPASGGVQRAFGTIAKPLQVGLAVDAGVRAARLARAGARSDLTSIEAWMPLVGGDPLAIELDGAAVPGGLAVKLSACCYALQRPIHVTRTLREQSGFGADVASIELRAPAAAVAPLHHHEPRTDMEGKFSLEYATAAALVGPATGPLPFTTDWVLRAEVQRLIGLVRFVPEGEGSGLLDGQHQVAITLNDGTILRASGTTPPGAPDLPPTEAELAFKIRECCGDLAATVEAADWVDAARILLTAAESQGLRAESSR